MGESLTMDIGEVAALLGRDERYVKRQHRVLARDGFPRPLPGAAWRWSRALVEIWVRTGGLASPSGLAGEAGNDNAAGDMVAAQRQALADRYGAQP